MLLFHGIYVVFTNNFSISIIIFTIYIFENVIIRVPYILPYSLFIFMKMFMKNMCPIVYIVNKFCLQIFKCFFAGVQMEAFLPILT